MNDPVQTDPSTQDTAPSGGDSQAAQVTAPPEVSQTDAPVDGAGSTADKPPHESAPADPAKQPPLDNSKSVAANTQSQPEAIDPEAFKRLRDEKSSWGRQMSDARRQQEEMRSQISRFQQEREQATRLADQHKLALHDFRHPEHQAKFQPILAKADIVRAQLARLGTSKPPDGLTPEQSQMWRDSQRDAIVGTLSQDEQNAIEQFQNHNQAFQRKMALNPGQALTEFVQPMLNQFWQAKQMEQEAQSSVQRDMQDPTLGPVLKEFQEPMMEMIERLGGTDDAYEMAKHHASVYAQNRSLSSKIASLEQQLGEAGIRAGVAANQQQLAKGKASITRDVVPRATKSPYDATSDWAGKNGVSKGSPQFFQHLREIEAEQAPR